MAEVVAYRHDGYELVFDTGDVETFEMPRDLLTTTGPGGWAHHEFGQHAHLNITFRPGKCAHWRPVARDEPAEPYARPLPSPVPQPLADAIRNATWTEL